MEPLQDSTGPQPATAPVRPGFSPKQFTSWRDSPWLCALAAIIGTGLLGAGLMAFSIEGYGSYGATLFCLSPAISAFMAVLLHEWARPSGGKGMWPITKAIVGVLAVVFALLCLLSLKLEGLICLAMALPVAFVMAVIGTGLGSLVVQVTGRPNPLPMLMSILVLYPAAQQYEVRNPAPVVPRLITTQLVVNAPPAQVWVVLTQPVQYPAATGWFRAGVVYPTRTALACDAATGRRTLVCRYSQGLAHLPVVAWQPGRQLTFAVPPADMPAPMHELSPYPQIHAPHLHGYFQVDSGTFRLRPLPGGRTLLEARTVYRHRIGPRFYWQLWSDYLLDTMH
ncbi:MAG: SRPBCC family protein, partial [Hymenobacter sp.]